MDYLLPKENETMEQFWERVHFEFRLADNHGTKRPRLNDIFRNGYRMYLDRKKQVHIEKIKEKLALPGAGTREGHRYRNQLANGKVEKRNPGSQGGRSSTYRSRDCREKYLLEANDNGYCRACKKKIWTDKAKVLCVDPQSITRKYVAVICKSCSQGENIKMHTRAGDDAWEWIKVFEDAHVRAWIRFKLATISEDRLDKFRAYVLDLPWEISPRR